MTQTTTTTTSTTTTSTASSFTGVGVVGVDEGVVVEVRHGIYCLNPHPQLPAGGQEHFDVDGNGIPVRPGGHGRGVRGEEIGGLRGRGERGGEGG